MTLMKQHEGGRVRDHKFDRLLKAPWPVAVLTFALLFSALGRGAEPSARGTGPNSCDDRKKEHEDRGEYWGPDTQLGRNRSGWLQLRQDRKTDLSWGIVKNGKPGDRVWIDVIPAKHCREEGKRIVCDSKWTQCGPFPIPAGKNWTATELGEITSRGNYTRVCGDRVQSNGKRFHKCTNWAIDD